MQPLSLTVQEIKDQTVIAKSAQGRVFEIPKETIFGTPTIGKELRLVGIASDQEHLGQTAFAQTLLNELLGK